MPKVSPFSLKRRGSGTAPLTSPLRGARPSRARASVSERSYRKPGESVSWRCAMIGPRSRSIPAVSTWTHRPVLYLSTIRPGRKSPSELISRYAAAPATSGRLRRSPMARSIRSRSASMENGAAPKESIRTRMADAGL